MSYFRRRLNKEEELTHVGYGLGWWRFIAVCFVLFLFGCKLAGGGGLPERQWMTCLILSILEKENNYLMYVGPSLPTNFFANCTLAICF